MRILLTRASVAMGDDATAPNAAERTLPDAATLTELAALVATAYVPRMGGACWVLSLGYGAPAGPPLALLAEPWERPRLLPAAQRLGPLAALADRDGELRTYCDYRWRESPEQVWRELTGRTP
ncbi:hypothetical protein GCM10009665_44570 [Kitasatospora nipponensis]|uniref:Uncharacterized protein n=1 Tax=Kitasatospora nipponensis TaxID=258049 RepID=A0ABP4H767_9ACTN